MLLYDLSNLIKLKRISEPLWPIVVDQRTSCSELLTNYYYFITLLKHWNIFWFIQRYIQRTIRVGKPFEKTAKIVIILFINFVLNFGGFLSIDLDCNEAWFIHGFGFNEKKHLIPFHLQIFRCAEKTLFSIHIFRKNQYFIEQIWLNYIWNDDLLGEKELNFQHQPDSLKITGHSKSIEI